MLFIYFLFFTMDCMYTHAAEIEDTEELEKHASSILP